MQQEGRATPDAADDAVAVGETALAQQFYAGRYAEILETTFDGDGGVPTLDLAFVVGALTFVDRVEEAEAVFEAALSASADPPDPRTVAAGRFFLGLAAARAGYFDRSFDLLVTRGLAARHARDPWIRAFVLQGLACQCYFTGRYPGAARNALRAAQAAHEAGFLYVAMLGTDMRGHSLVQMGQLQRGIAMLERAGQQARRLGLTNNAFALEASIAIYATRFDPRLDALERVEALLARRAHDSYSRRALFTEAAVQRALRGQRSAADRALEAAERDALRGDTRRGKIVTLLARLWVTRCRSGPAACRELVEQAAALIEPRDVAFRAELLGFELLVARADGDREREERALAELRELWRTTHHFYAKAGLTQLDESPGAGAFDEDAVTPLLRAVLRRELAALSRIVGLGLHGLVPELLGLVPGRRIILVPSEHLLLLEDHGDVVVRHRPPRWCPALLRILASGEATKQRIVHGLWGLRAYHPELHDPPVRTTIHRLRAFLRPHGAWIEVGDDGYRTTVPVHVVTLGELAPETTPLWEEGEVPALAPRATPAVVRREPAGDGPEQLVLHRLEGGEPASAPELARALELSASTVLRALRALVAARHVERIGYARATRYRLRPRL